MQVRTNLNLLWDSSSPLTFNGTFDDSRHVTRKQSINVVPHFSPSSRVVPSPPCFCETHPGDAGWPRNVLHRDLRGNLRSVVLHKVACSNHARITWPEKWLVRTVMYHVYTSKQDFRDNLTLWYDPFPSFVQKAVVSIWMLVIKSIFYFEIGRNEAKAINQTQKKSHKNKESQSIHWWLQASTAPLHFYSISKDSWS